MIEIRPPSTAIYTWHLYELWCGDVFLAYAKTLAAALWAKREIERGLAGH
jgi:hypothetical protein